MTAPVICSVVVPTFNRPELLDRCLTALGHQTLDANRYEVVIVDDAASSMTYDQVIEHAKRLRPRVRYLSMDGARHGPAAARNTGWQAARGSIVAFTDDDTVPDPQWLSNIVAAIADGADAIWGRIVVPLSNRPTDYEKDAAGLETAGFVTANCACRRAVLERIHGFDERFRSAWREDSDLFFRLLASRANVAAAPDALVVHPVRPASWGVSVKQQRKSMYDALLKKKHPARFNESIVPSRPYAYYPIVLSLLGAGVFAMTGNRRFARGSLAIWGLLTTRFVAKRLAGTSHAPSHVLEMIATSIIVPPLSLMWRLRGALAFRTVFW